MPGLPSMRNRSGVSGRYLTRTAHPASTSGPATGHAARRRRTGPRSSRPSCALARRSPTPAFPGRRRCGRRPPETKLHGRFGAIAVGNRPVTALDGDDPPRYHDPVPSEAQTEPSRLGAQRQTTHPAPEKDHGDEPVAHGSPPRRSWNELPDRPTATSEERQVGSARHRAGASAKSDPAAADLWPPSDSAGAGQTSRIRDRAPPAAPGGIAHKQPICSNKGVVR